VDLLGAFTKLTLNKAMKPEGGAYATIIAPNQSYDVMQDTKFVDAGVRGNNKGLFNGEIGTWYGNRIIVTTEEWIEDGAGSEGTYVANPTEKIFSAMVLGRNYFGAPIMAGNSPFSPSVITRKGADSGDPLGQSQSVGWKAYWTAKVLNDQWAVILRTKSTFA
jgi:N4-gp56 family major capsid protein